MTTSAARADLAIAVDNLAKSFGGFHAVEGISFAVAPGETVALIGPNGAGKSTTFNLINGQLRPDSGTIHVGGNDVTGRPPRELWEQGVGRTFQITATFASMTVRETVAIGVMRKNENPWGFGRMQALDGPETTRLIAAVGLSGSADRICGTLAYGDLKRVELALALAGRPRLLLMDEPTAGMAAAERGALMELAVSSARAAGAAILFTEHDMGVVFRYAARVLVMSRGRIVAAGTPEEIRADSIVREVYLGSRADRG